MPPTSSLSLLHSPSLPLATARDRRGNNGGTAQHPPSQLFDPQESRLEHLCSPRVENHIQQQQQRAGRQARPGRLA
eukprot:jgi/Tetstr1/443895/TSEL_031847.t1